MHNLKLPGRAFQYVKFAVEPDPIGISNIRSQNVLYLNSNNTKSGKSSNFILFSTLLFMAYRMDVSDTRGSASLGAKLFLSEAR